MAQPPRGLSQLGRQAIWVLRDEGQGHGPFSPPPSSPATCCILFIVKLGFLGAAFLDTAVPSSHSCLSPQRSSEPLEHSSAPTLSPAIFPSRPWHPLVMALRHGNLTFHLSPFSSSVASQTLLHIKPNANHLRRTYCRPTSGWLCAIVPDFLS